MSALMTGRGLEDVDNKKKATQLQFGLEET